MNEQSNKTTDRCISGQAHFGAAVGYGVVGDGTGLGAFGMRQNARSVIRDRIGQLRTEAARLEALLDALPQKLPPDADQALWALAIAARR